MPFRYQPGHDSKAQAQRARRVPFGTRGRREVLAIGAVLVVGLLVSAVAFFVLRGWERDRVALGFTRAAEDISASIQLRVETNLDAVRALGALYMITDQVTPNQFATFAQPFLARNPSLTRVGWLPRVPHEARDDFEARARRDIPDFQAITEGAEARQPVRAAARAEYFPVRYVAPYAGNEGLLGFDAGSNPLLAEALRRARDSGEIAAAETMAIAAQGTAGGPMPLAKVVYQPVYRRGAPTDTASERHANLRGLVAASFGVADTVEYSLRYAVEWGVDLYLYERASGGQERLVYFRPSPLRAIRADVRNGPPNGGLQLRKSLDVAGSEWVLLFVPAPGMYSVARSWLPWGAALAGILFTGLLAAYLGLGRAYTSRVEHLVGALEGEVDERRRAEVEAQRSRDFLSAILDTAAALVVLLDRDGRIRGFNRACESLTGYSFEEVKGRRLWEIFLLPEEIPRVKEAFRALLAGAASNQYDSYWVSKDGNRHLIGWSNTRLTSSEGNLEYVVVTGVDLTDRRRAEGAEKATEMAHLLRLSTLGEMASGIAHEVNQPLAAILTYTQTCIRMMKARSGETDVQEILGKIAMQAERTAEIIRRFRGFARKEEPRREAADINDVLHEALGILEAEIRKNGVQLRTRLGDALPPVCVDQLQIEQVVVNLARNAIEAMQAQERGRRALTLTSAQTKGGIEVSISDTGPGLKDHEITQVFHPFFTTKPQGVGLGLSISQSIVEAHGGRLWWEPNAAGGSAFRFTLPVWSRGQYGCR